MREAVLKAEFGDDVYDEDPTTKELEFKMCQLLHKESSLFVPSGTMSNLIATLAHCSKRGSEAYCGKRSHMLLFEQGAMAQFAGVQTYGLDNFENGTFSLQELEERIIENERGEDFHRPIPSLICIENTHCYNGGRVLPLPWLHDLESLKDKYGIPLHVDGARLYNAALVSQVPISELVNKSDSVNVCLSKGIGAPFGSILSGSYDFIQKAKRIRKALGGGMRQSGFVAAPALIALSDAPKRLLQDHQKAQIIAQSIQNLKTDVIWIKTVETNIICVYVNKNIISTIELIQELGKVRDGVLVQAFALNQDCIRLVTHSNMSEEDAFCVTKVFEKIVDKFN